MGMLAFIGLGMAIFLGAAAIVVMLMAWTGKEKQVRNK
jgi:hypothetical protein